MPSLNEAASHSGHLNFYILSFSPVFLLSPIRALIAGGGAPEIELAVRLAEYSRTLGGMEAYCVRAYSDALEVIPSTLAENAGLNPISTVTELRNRHAQGDKMAGINVRKVRAASLQGRVHNNTLVSAWGGPLFSNVS